MLKRVLLIAGVIAGPVVLLLSFVLCVRTCRLKKEEREIEEALMTPEQMDLAGSVSEEEDAGPTLKPPEFSTNIQL